MLNVANCWRFKTVIKMLPLLLILKNFPWTTILWQSIDKICNTFFFAQTRSFLLCLVLCLCFHSNVFGYRRQIDVFIIQQIKWFIQKWLNASNITYSNYILIETPTDWLNHQFYWMKIEFFVPSFWQSLLPQKLNRA